jgi:hypothetical protein
MLGKNTERLKPYTRVGSQFALTDVDLFIKTELKKCYRVYLQLILSQVSCHNA